MKKFIPLKQKAALFMRRRRRLSFTPIGVIIKGPDNFRQNLSKR